MTGLYDTFAKVEAIYGDKESFRYFENLNRNVPDSIWSFHEFMNTLRGAANLFHHCGIGDSDTVGLIVPNTPHGQVSLFAAEVSGRALPINPLLHDNHIIALLNATAAKVLVVTGDLQRALEIRKAVPSLEHIFSLDGGDYCFSSALENCPQESLQFAPRTSPETVVATFHTGGTTGTPKLVQHCQSNQIAVAGGMATNAAFDSSDIIVNALPLFHVAGSMCFALSSLLAGACQILCTPLGARTPDFVTEHWNIVESQGVTVTGGVPTMIGALLSSLPKKKPEKLTRIITGGAMLPVSVQQEYIRRLGIHPQIIYGMTECAGLLALTTRETLPLGWTGPAIEGMEIRVVQDPGDSGSVALPNETGHVIAKGSTLGPGYTDPDKNRDAFTDDGWLVTGDLGMMDDRGNLKLTGRAKDLIIRSGHNIDPILIEEAALKHPHVTAAAAVGAPDGYAGELPVLFVESSIPQEDLDREDILSIIRNEVERPAVPKWIEVLDSLPVTPVGKTYKPALTARAIEKTVRRLLAEQKLDDVELTVTETNGISEITFAAEPGNHQAIHDLMASLPLEYVIV